jgi:hypothetical protein
VAASAVVLLVAANLTATMPYRRSFVGAVVLVAGVLATQRFERFWLTVAVLGWLVFVDCAVRSVGPMKGSGRRKLLELFGPPRESPPF